MYLGQSESLFNRAIQVMPSGVNSPVRYYEPYPFFVSSGMGNKIITSDHHTFLDYSLGYGVLLLGHCDTDILKEVSKQLSNGTLFCIPTEKEVLLSELISKIIPSAEMTRIMNTGSEATMHAIRLSRAYTKRSKIIKFDGGYHGAHDSVLVKAGSGASAISSNDGTMSEYVNNTLVAQYNNLESLYSLVDKYDDDIACIIIEPVLANMGLILPNEGYLNEIRKITKDHDIVLIFDEVVTGFRLSLGGASEFFGIEPDLLTFAKAMGNGFPISALCGKKEIMQNLSPSGNVYQASTFAGNPISVTAALSTLQKLVENKNRIYPFLSRTCNYLTNGIKDLISDYKVNASINSIGSMFQIFFNDKLVVSDVNTARESDIELFRKFYFLLLEKNIFIPPSQFETCFLSVSHSEEDSDKTIDAYRECLKTLNE